MYSFLKNILRRIKKKSKKNIGRWTPFKLLPEDCNYIFIHIPKCAGWSISQALYGKQITHIKFSQYFDADNQLFGNYKVFSVVRDPIERFLSAYNFLKKGGINEADFLWAKENFSGIENVNEFIKKIHIDSAFSKTVLQKHHFESQYSYLVNDKQEIDNRIKLIPFSKMHKLQNILKQELGLTINIEHLNKTTYPSEKEKLNPLSIEILSELYKKDATLYLNANQNFNNF